MQSMQSFHLQGIMITKVWRLFLIMPRTQNITIYTAIYVIVVEFQAKLQTIYCNMLYANSNFPLTNLPQKSQVVCRASPSHQPAHIKNKLVKSFKQKYIYKQKFKKNYNGHEIFIFLVFVLVWSLCLFCEESTVTLYCHMFFVPACIKYKNLKKKEEVVIQCLLLYFSDYEILLINPF